MNPLSNEKVRLALNLAADKDAIIAIVTHGVGTPMSSYMSTATPYHVGQGAQFPVDVDKAKKLMKDAGFEKGFSFSCVVIAGDVDEVGIATALQQMWSQIGVTLTIEQVDNATLTSHYRPAIFDARAVGPTTSPIPTRSPLPPTADHRIPAFEAEERKADKLFEDSQKRLVQKRAEQLRASGTHRAGRSSHLWSPYPVVLKEQQGFLQIPLGNNIFSRLISKEYGGRDAGIPEVLPLLDPGFVAALDYPTFAFIR